MAPTLYIVLSLLLGLANLLIGYVTFKRPEPEARFLAVCLFSSFFVNICYLGSILVGENYALMSVFSSVHYVSIDLTLIFLLLYALVFTDQKKFLWNHWSTMIILVFFIVDAAILLTNPLHGLAITYTYDPEALVPWHHDNTVFFNVHLYYCYFITLIIFVNILVKIASVPQVYRGRYSLAGASFLALLGVNAALLFFPDPNFFDYSVLFYSLVAFVFYWTGFKYGNKMMLEQTSMMVVEGFGHPAVIFDNESRFVYANNMARGLFSHKLLVRDLTVEEFVGRFSMMEEGMDFSHDTTFHLQSMENGILESYRCDFRRYEDDRGRMIAQMFVLYSTSYERDLLTGFYAESTFNENAWLIAESMTYPIGVLVCDINNLSAVNMKHGKESGDTAIRTLASTLRKNFPKSAYFARLSEANLLVLCPSATNDYMRTQFSLVTDEFCTLDFGDGPLSLQSSISFVTSKDSSLLDSVATAFSSMKARKLLDSDSSHSSLLDSVVQTQRESDGETEEHVKRTQLLGEKLGERLGLSDGEQSSLALLCLLHDVGKVGIPLEILNKPGKLSEEEWDIMRTHVEKGYRIASASPELEGIANLILHHHEAWDGSGYPDGLANEAIPLLSRILSVVDTYDAMTNNRPYRHAVSHEQAKKELMRCAGTQFDPHVVAEFLALLDNESFANKVAPYVSRNSFITPSHTATIRPMGVADNEPVRYNPRFIEDPDNVFLRYVPHSRYILDNDLNIIEIDEEFTNITGYTREDVDEYKLTQLDLIYPEETQAYSEIVGETMSGKGEAYIEHKIRRKDGIPRYVFCYGYDHYDPIRRVVRSIVVIADLMYADTVKMLIRRERISARRSISLLENSARRDALTNLYNRSVFRSEIQSALLKAESRILFLLVDLDEFKEYNDAYGHPQGDELLRVLASGLEEAVYPSGFASRMGGDEFAAAIVIDGDASREDVEETVRNFFDHVSRVLQDYAPGVTISAGAALSRIDSSQSFANLYKQADRALYEVKRNGRSGYFLSDN